jgi:hypothetical protein
MNAFALIAGVSVLAITAIATGFNPMASIQNIVAPQQLQEAPRSPVQTAPKTEQIEMQPLPKPKPTAVEKPKPKSKPKPPLKVAERPAYCGDLDRGVSLIGKEGVRLEARRRGKTEAAIANAEQACGYK